MLLWHIKRRLTLAWLDLLLNKMVLWGVRANLAVVCISMLIKMIYLKASVFSPLLQSAHYFLSFSYHKPSMSKLCLDIMTLFLCDAPALSNRNTSAKGTETRQCGWLIGAAWLSMFFHFGKRWLSLYWPAFYITFISFPFSFSFLLFSSKHEGELGMPTQLIFLMFLYDINYGHVHFIVLRDH